MQDVGEQGGSGGFTVGPSNGNQRAIGGQLSQDFGPLPNPESGSLKGNEQGELRGDSGCGHNEQVLSLT